MNDKELIQTAKFLKVVHDLRTHCPWDRKQTHQSLVTYLLEETYEVVEAIESKDSSALKEELGDLLLQIALHCEIASEKKVFDFESVSKDVAQKMIHRHPHVYGDVKIKDEKEHLQNWQKLKEKEKPGRGILEGLPRALPALQRAQKIGKRVSAVGFDWEKAEDSFEKVKEEINELKVEMERESLDLEALSMEMGDVLFALTNLCRHLKLDAENCLRKSNEKFFDRFSRLEAHFKKAGKELTSCTLKEMDGVWEKLK